MLRAKVMAASVAGLTDARYFAAWGVEWLGFSLDRADGARLAPLEARAIREWVDGVKIVGEFGLSDIEEMLEALESIPLEAVKTGMHTSPETLAALAAKTFVFQEWIAEDDSAPGRLSHFLASNKPWVDVFTLDFARNGFSWAALRAGQAPISLPFLRDLARRYPLLLAVDWLPEDLPDALDQSGALGLQLRGEAETQTGFKSFERLDAIFERLESD
jgi:phosphoribosylanthranilate isomerase